MKQRALTAVAIFSGTLITVLLSKYIVYSVVIALLALTAVFEILRVVGVEKRFAIAFPAYACAAVFPTFAYFVRVENIKDFLLLLFALKSEFSVIHDPRDRGSTLRSNEHEIKSLVICGVESTYCCKYSELFAVRSYDSELCGLGKSLFEDFFVDQMFFLTRPDGKAPPS